MQLCCLMSYEESILSKTSEIALFYYKHSGMTLLGNNNTIKIINILLKGGWFTIACKICKFSDDVYDRDTD